MAEGWAHHLRAHDIAPYSAGIEAHGLNPYAVAVMAEVGVDISAQKSQTVDELADLHFDLVVTVCAHADRHCPARLKNTELLHVGFDDPPALAKSARNEAESMAIYRRVRDEIRTFVAGLRCAGLG
jgi:arsenate reductase